MYLHISHELKQQITSHAHADYPHEVCGILAGTGHVVECVIPVENSAADPKHSFLIGRDALNQHLPTLNGLQVLGFYHSHPTGNITPSPTDIRDTVLDTLHVIADTKGHLAAWQIQRGRVYSVEIISGEVPAKQDEPLTRQQKMAIILSVIFALSILIILSLALLPPAPELP